MPKFLNKLLTFFGFFYAFWLETFLWIFLLPYIHPRDAFFAGSVEGLNFLKIQILTTGKLKSKINNFHGIVMPTHKGIADFYIQCGIGFPATLSRFLFLFLVYY